MILRLKRRDTIAVLASLLLFGRSRESLANALYGGDNKEYFDPALLPPEESEIDFPIEKVDQRRIKKSFRRQIVDFEYTYPLGSIVVDPDNRFLFYIIDQLQAIRYGVGVGRAGFAWSGSAVVGMKRKWPRWVPPRDMVDRDQNARRWMNGQPGGPDNPLGARALYLFSNGRDTLYRIHGTNEPQSIGKAVSSGCIRMLNEDIAHLYELVEVGTPVVVRASHDDAEERVPHAGSDLSRPAL
jgi:lipoprotein-anchoring transpeptidase ErfK/SrfK